MKKKVGTILEEELLYKAKRVALFHKQSLSQLLEDALKMYLLSVDKNTVKKQKNISQSTHGTMKIPRSVLKNIMDDEGIYEA
jgi:hypothetical protein